MASETNNALDAYQPPTPVYGDRQPKIPGAGRIKAIAIIAIVLGCLGVFSSLGGIVGLLFGQQIQGTMSAPSQQGMPAEIGQLQKDMQDDLQAIQDRFMLINAVLIAVTAVVSVSLLIGGVQCLRRVVPARKVLLVACSAAFVFELLRAAVQAVIQVQVIPMTMKHTERIMEFSSGPQQVTEFAMIFARIIVVVGIAMGVLWLLAKLIFFGISVRHLRKPAVCAYLDGDSGVDQSHVMELPQ